MSFDFLGYSFRPRTAVDRRKEFFVSFTPAVSRKAGTRASAMSG
jgi:RNA-directed DNA polymerase